LGTLMKYSPAFGIAPPILRSVNTAFSAGFTTLQLTLYVKFGGTGVLVGVDVLVLVGRSVGVFVEVLVGRGVLVLVRVFVGRGVLVFVRVAVAVGVLVTVGVFVRVGVFDAVGVLDGVGVLVAVGFGQLTVRVRRVPPELLIAMIYVPPFATGPTENDALDPPVITPIVPV
jgi:hypothetical protein